MALESRQSLQCVLTLTQNGYGGGGGGFVRREGGEQASALKETLRGALPKALLEPFWCSSCVLIGPFGAPC